MPDYQSLFQASAPWTRAAQGTQVFKLTTQFLAGAPDDVLRRVFSDLRRRQISIAWAGLMLTATHACGAGIEGYEASQTIEKVTDRIRRLGGDLKYVAMDEPLWFGHVADLPNACQTSIEDLARAVAEKVAIIKRSFPQAQIGDVEVVGTLRPPHWVDELMTWETAYREATGESLAFLHADVLWGGPWRDQLRDISSRLRSRHIKFGIIYNGDPDDQTNLSWVRHAENRFVNIEGELSLAPDHAILQTWMLRPTHMLPETEPGTLTWLVDRYLASPSRLTVKRTQIRLDGLLTDSAGRPLIGEIIHVFVKTSGIAGGREVRVVKGIVPTGAASALFGLRINTECDCSGVADVTLGPLVYQDDGADRKIHRAFGSLDTFTHFRVTAAQTVMQNTQSFPVIAGSPFTVEVPVHATAESHDSGYVSLIFQDAQGRGIERVRLQFDPTNVVAGEANTDAQGKFSMPISSALAKSADAGFTIEYNGNEKYRSAAYSLP